MTSGRVAELRQLPSIRNQCKKVYELATEGRLRYFEYHPENESNVVDFCKKIIEVCQFSLNTLRSANKAFYFRETSGRAMTKCVHSLPISASIFEQDVDQASRKMEAPGLQKGAYRISD